MKISVKTVLKPEKVITIDGVTSSDWISILYDLEGTGYDSEFVIMDYKVKDWLEKNKIIAVCARGHCWCKDDKKRENLLEKILKVIRSNK